MTEDEIYRASTQFRLWSFTPATLARLRKSTNVAAAERVRSAVRRQSVADGEGDATRKVECLTVEEEQMLISFYCEKCRELGQFFNFPINVIATAIQYLHRFYLSNSPMTYHPKALLPTALFLATKTENNHIFLKDFAAKIPRTVPDDVLAPEFILTQGLRYCFDVRHPHRGLRGIYLEMLSIAAGTASPSLACKRSAAELQRQIHALPQRPSRSQPHDIAAAISPLTEPASSPSTDQKASLVRRLEAAYGRASETLKTAAILSDAYFLYSPSHICLAALRSADGPITDFYLGTKFPAADEGTFSDGWDSEEARRGKSSDGTVSLDRLIYNVNACSMLLQQYSHANPMAGGEAAGVATAAAHEDEEKAATRAKERKEELVRIDKKLYRCRNPEKVDLIGLNRAVKRNGSVVADTTAARDARDKTVRVGEESAAKRRRLEKDTEGKGKNGDGGGAVGKKNPFGGPLEVRGSKG